MVRLASFAYVLHASDPRYRVVSGGAHQLALASVLIRRLGARVGPLSEPLPELAGHARLLLDELAAHPRSAIRDGDALLVQQLLHRDPDELGVQTRRHPLEGASQQGDLAKQTLERASLISDDDGVVLGAEHAGQSTTHGPSLVGGETMRHNAS